jgi:endonuclease YncB( thermonuclease family)
MKTVLQILCLLVFFQSHGQELSGKVVSIADGDTFTMLVEGNKQVKIRLHGIDCPEKSQDFGQVAKKYLSDLVYNKTVRVREMDTDRYGRTIGMVMIDSVNVNEALLKAGLAWHYTRYDKNPKWSVVEKKARAGKKGLWSKPDAVAPWEFRKSKTLVKAGAGNE